MPDPARARAVLTIDLDAVVGNWRLLCRRASPAACAAVVKADAYGLGAAVVAPALARAGCREFFVATLDEALALREAAAAATIYVLDGVLPGTESDLAAARLVPVLNSLACLQRWGATGRRHARRLPAALHVDTGMSRLGLPADELDLLSSAPDRLDDVDLVLLMSHLACADEPLHPKNADQRDRFRRARAMLPPTRASLANSSGVFLGSDYACDLVRPGAALYGVAPVPGAANPMRPVVRLEARILQVRDIDSGATVGYGATHEANDRRRIATAGVGYADGWLRSLGNRGCGSVGGRRAPLVGLVSMDLCTFDVSDVPPDLARPGSTIELIGATRSIDDVAAEAGTIGYEILTALGSRYARVYLPVQD